MKMWAMIVFMSICLALVYLFIINNQTTESGPCSADDEPTPTQLDSSMRDDEVLPPPRPELMHSNPPKVGKKKKGVTFRRDQLVTLGPHDSAATNAPDTVTMDDAFQPLSKASEKEVTAIQKAVMDTLRQGKNSEENIQTPNATIKKAFQNNVSSVEKIRGADARSREALMADLVANERSSKVLGPGAQDHTAGYLQGRELVAVMMNPGDTSTFMGTDAYYAAAETQAMQPI